MSLIEEGWVGGARWRGCRRGTEFNRFMWATQPKPGRGHMEAPAATRDFACSALDLSIVAWKAGLTLGQRRRKADPTKAL